MTGRQTPLDAGEMELVERSRGAADMDQAQLIELTRRLRERRDRVQRAMRSRSRQAQADGGDAGPDTGAREKKAALVEALERTTAELDRRAGGRASARATDNLRAAVEAKAETKSWRGPESRTADLGPAETPNRKIAPSGALHAEGMRAAISRSTGDR